ncbi:MAG: undecaprenyldiphospho-muramoylpentapeptide beta-N-acetylglucosaminyltransferase [Myxococcales bacterium FL481]|nr:MAG: undecaprenyldiphospho-muramoylpentapeptide beta-N-acetylglucosaminyltransferase [Myxococcales bacterium FL481]
MPNSASSFGPQRRLLIAGGGTGGHLFPGIAVAERVRADGGQVHFVGTARGVESRLLPELGWPLSRIKVAGLKGRGLSAKLGVVARLPAAYFACRRLVREFRPTAVVGVGGYASGPMVMTAWSMGIPTAILEQNSIPGLTNRCLSRVVRRVCTMFEDEAQAFPPAKVKVTGNPVRAALIEQLSVGDAAPRTESARLLVFGGSQGARAINEAMMKLAPQLAERVPGFELWHQTGTADEPRVRAAYEQAGLDHDKHRVMPFITDMAAAYAWSDAVLCRAGATSVAELTFSRRPAVFVPLPSAADNHQEHNARAVVEAGGAWMVRQDELGSRRTIDTIVSLLTDADQRATMGQAMHSLARAGAVDAVLAEIDAISVYPR